MMHNDELAMALAFRSRNSAPRAFCAKRTSRSRPDAARLENTTLRMRSVRTTLASCQHHNSQSPSVSAQFASVLLTAIVTNAKRDFRSARVDSAADHRCRGGGREASRWVRPCCAHVVSASTCDSAALCSAGPIVRRVDDRHVSVWIASASPRPSPRRLVGHPSVERNRFSQRRRCPGPLTARPILDVLATHSS